jgi:cobalamin synthase
MIIGAIAVGAGIFAVMLILALSKKTDAKIRKALLLALAVMLLASIGCLVIALWGRPAASRGSNFPYSEFAEPPRPQLDMLQLLVIIGFIAILFAAIVVLAIRERKKTYRE